jgi:hypothetical protein
MRSALPYFSEGIVRFCALAKPSSVRELDTWDIPAVWWKQGSHSPTLRHSTELGFPDRRDATNATLTAERTPIQRGGFAFKARELWINARSDHRGRLNSAGREGAAYTGPPADVQRRSDDGIVNWVWLACILNPGPVRVSRDV